MKEFLKKVWAFVLRFKQFFLGFVSCLMLFILIAIMKGC